ncbi:MAG: epoxyqueuosine reductase QueH [Elusimicrobiota bacterium]|nr:epoxyqueuosine reductase QueH [Elusimicrobiota bacterium]
MSKVLLHICCGICATTAVEKLKEENFEVIGFFYNPNIHPVDEYKKRLSVAKQVSQLLDFDLIEGDYDKDNWFKLTDKFKDEPEGGKRCEVCFNMRLTQTYKKLKELNITFFTTTLTLSPHKNTSIVNRIGLELDKKIFLEYNFKKAHGFKKAIEFSKKYNLYRQNYCGCIYSIKRQIQN